ncbi:MAG: efflux RND transporter periplasmic adaptor subunit [Gammaproteobacteria bacterium]|nr:efflux RND transporter periplasmic adaptor subunit [Gammaproteobacteria bacterium]
MKKYALLFLLFVQSMNAYCGDAEYPLTTAVSGVVKQVLVKSGEKVKQGQILLVLDQRVIKARLQAAEKKLESAKLDLAEVKKELERTEELYDRTVISNHELEVAKVNFARAEAAFSNVNEEHAKAQYDMDYSQIVSPIAGKVKQLNAWVGMVVNNAQQNTTLITLVK